MWPPWLNALTATVNRFTGGNQIRHFVMAITGQAVWGCPCQRGKLSTSGQSSLASPLGWLGVRAPGCKPELGALLRSCAHKSATAQLSLSALCEAAEEAVVLSAAGCTNVTPIIS